MSASGMARDRDIAAFGDRTPGYDQGWRGRMHHQIADDGQDGLKDVLVLGDRFGERPSSPWASQSSADR